MTKNIFSRTVLVLSLICSLGFGSHAVAQMQGGKMQGCSMAGGKGCPGLKQLKGLSDKEREQVQSEMTAQHKILEPIKQAMFEKKMELISVLAKQKVDADKAKKLQSNISDLKNQIGQKKIDFLIRIKKISPEAGRFCLEKCFMKHQGMGGCKGAGSCPGKKKLDKTSTN